MSENKQLKHKQAKKKKKGKSVHLESGKKAGNETQVGSAGSLWYASKAGNARNMRWRECEKNLKTKTQIGEIIEYPREERVNCLDSCWLLMNLFV